MKKPVARVLAVEDDTDIADMMRLALARSLIEANTASTGEEALLRLTTETYDLILLDIALPGMNGLEACRQLKASPRLKDIPVIFVSGHGSPENKALAKRLGAVDFVEKPFQMLQLLSCIMGHLKLGASGQRDLRQAWPLSAP